MVVVELSKFGLMHIEYNAAMEKVMRKVFPEEELEFWGEKEHLVHIREKIGSKDLGIMKQIKVINPVGTASWMLKLWVECISAIRILRYGHKSRQMVVYLSMFPTTLFALKWAKVFFPNVKVLVCIHGELEFVRTKSRNLKIRFFRFFMRKALLLERRYFLQIVHGEIILENLRHILPVNVEFFMVIEHPYLFDAPISGSKREAGSPLAISHIGRANLLKGSNLFFDLALLLKDVIEKGVLRLKVVGWIYKELIKYRNEYVEVETTDDLLGVQEFNSGISQTDYIIFFYNNESYKLCSSGAIFDAFRHLKPIISIRNDYFDYIIGKVGEIGYVVENVSEMEQTIRRILTSDEFEYNHFVNNLLQGRHFFTVEQVAASIDQQLCRLKWK